MYTKSDSQKVVEREIQARFGCLQKPCSLFMILLCEAFPLPHLTNKMGCSLRPRVQIVIPDHSGVEKNSIQISSDLPKQQVFPKSKQTACL